MSEFRESLQATTPPTGLPPSLDALWQEAGGNWERAHLLVQQREGEQACDWTHAYLHRKEGDLSNAAYWYRRAGKPVATSSLEAEWAEIVTTLFG